MRKKKQEMDIYLTAVQKKIIKKKCPACGIGRLHAVEGETENNLWCNNCDCSVDSDGGYIN